MPASETRPTGLLAKCAENEPRYRAKAKVDLQIASCNPQPDVG